MHRGVVPLSWRIPCGRQGEWPIVSPCLITTADQVAELVAALRKAPLVFFEKVAACA